MSRGAEAKPRPEAAEITATIARLAASPREVMIGRRPAMLPGVCMSDLARALKFYPHQIQDRLADLLAAGSIQQQQIGPYMCYFPTVTPSKESAA